MQAVIRSEAGEVIENPPGTGIKDYYGKVFIDIKDDFGNPINGDNVQVYYRRVYNGSIGDKESVIVPGLSYLIFDGITGRTGSPDGNFSITYLVDSLASGFPSPPPTPNIKINSVTIVQKADTGGANGKVQINATSSYLPIEFYIDDVIGDSSRTGIATGNHVAKVIDPNGAEASLPFYMPQIDSMLQSTPAKLIGGLISRWNAAFNPVVFQFERTDFKVLGITQDSTALKPKINIDADLTGVVAGDYIYLNYSPYQGAYKVLNLIGTANAVIDTDYLAPAASDGFVNINALRPYYKVVTRVKFVNVDTGLFQTVVSTNRPDVNGITKADISSLLQSILKPLPDASNYTLANYRDMGLGASYQVSFAEVWDGNTPEFTDIEDPFYCVYAAKQIQQLGGGNLYEYVTQPGGTQPAKWLTDFIEPSYSTGYPFDLPFIYSEQIAGRDIYCKIIPLDINREPIGDGDITTFLLNEDSSYLLNEDGSKFVIARSALVNTPIVEHVGVNRLLINQDFGNECWYLDVQLFYDDEDTPIPVTQSIIVRVDRVCDSNPVYLRFIGLNGGWNYYRFNYNQTKTLDVQNAVIIKNYVDDFEAAEGIEQVISKDASNKMQLFADALDRNDIDGLSAIKYSPIVQVLSNGNPVKWQNIVVNSSTFTEYDTQNEQYEFSITYNLPSKNIQSV